MANLEMLMQLVFSLGKQPRVVLSLVGNYQVRGKRNVGCSHRPNMQVVKANDPRQSQQEVADLFEIDLIWNTIKK